SNASVTQDIAPFLRGRIAVSGDVDRAGLLVDAEADRSYLRRPIGADSGYSGELLATHVGELGAGERIHLITINPAPDFRLRRACSGRLLARHPASWICTSRASTCSIPRPRRQGAAAALS